MAAMHRFVAAGGVFNEESLRHHNPSRHSLIALSETEDGELWIRDGYHRIYVISFYGRPLHADEYFIEQRSYDEYQTINLARTWVTPFDPRKEIRKADFLTSNKRPCGCFMRGGTQPILSSVTAIVTV
jgi:hypothetical protein